MIVYFLQKRGNVIEDIFKKIFEDQYLVEVGLYDLRTQLYPKYFDCKEVTDLIQFDRFCLSHINDIQIEIIDVLSENDNLFFKTSIGTFLIVNRFYDKKFIQDFINVKMSLYDFATKVIYQDLNVNFEDTINKNKNYHSFFEYFYSSVAYKILPIYSYYKVITNKIDKKTIIKLTNIKNQNHEEMYNFIPLEVICNSEFYSPISTGNFAYHFSNLREKYKFDENKNLTFLSIINCLDNKVLDEYYNRNMEDKIKLLYQFSKVKRNEAKKYIIDNISDFKKFVKNIINYRPYLISRFITSEDLLKYFTDDELFDIYKSSSSIYSVGFNFEMFENLDIRARNNSELVTLDDSHKKVHVKYELYDIYDETTFVFRKNKIDAFSKINNFEDLFILYNEIIMILYRKYHKKYLELKKEDEEDNIYNFLKNLLSKNMITRFYIKNMFSSYELFEIEKIVEYINPELYLQIKDIKKELTTYFLNFYKEIILSKDDKEEFLNILKKYNISNNEFYNFVLDSPFLYNQDKNTLINIYQCLFERPLRIIDILFIVDEMIERKISLSDILREKKIPKKVFVEVYNDLRENNEKLYVYIFESLNVNKKRGFIKLIRFGATVLESNINSIEEYNQKFNTNMTFEKLLSSLRKTNIGMELYKKAKTFSDFEDSKFSVKDNKLVLRKREE